MGCAAQGTGVKLRIQDRRRGARRPATAKRARKNAALKLGVFQKLHRAGPLLLASGENRFHLLDVVLGIIADA